LNDKDFDQIWLWRFASQDLAEFLRTASGASPWCSGRSATSDTKKWLQAADEELDQIRI